MLFLGCFGFLIWAQTLAMHAHAGDRTDIARQQRTEARGWLQLERDQTLNRERAGALPPSASRGLEIRERMERNDKRGLDLRQRQDLQGQESKDRLSRSLGELRPATRALDLRHRRQLDQQRLQMRMNRDIQR